MRSLYFFFVALWIGGLAYYLIGQKMDFDFEIHVVISVVVFLFAFLILTLIFIRDKKGGEPSLASQSLMHNNSQIQINPNRQPLPNKSINLVLLDESLSDPPEIILDVEEGISVGDILDGVKATFGFSNNGLKHKIRTSDKVFYDHQILDNRALNNHFYYFNYDPNSLEDFIQLLIKFREYEIDMEVAPNDKSGEVLEMLFADPGIKKVVGNDRISQYNFYTKNGYKLNYNDRFYEWQIRSGSMIELKKI